MRRLSQLSRSKAVGVVMLVVGALTVLGGLAADLLGWGHYPGLGIRQMLGVAVGTGLAVGGAVLLAYRSSGIWRLALLVIGDIAVAIIAYELVWNIPTISSFGIFEAPLSKDGLVNVPRSYWAVVLSQIVLFSLAGLYRPINFTPKRTLLRIPPILFLQMMFLGFLYRVSFLLRVPGFYPGPLSTFFSIFPVFWVLNSTFTSLWRALTFYPGPLAAFFGKIGGRRDLAQILILGFMILLIPCAILLTFQAQKTKELIAVRKVAEAQKIVEAEKTVEEIANVAYSLLVLGVGMRLISMIRRKND